jgi:hypothetical protein
VGSRIAAAQPASSAVLVLSQEPFVVRIAVRGDSPCNCLNRSDCKRDLGSPVREIRTPGSAWGDGHKVPCRLGEATDPKGSDPARLRQGYRAKACPYQPHDPACTLSPLLANLYFRRFILGWKKLGLMARYQAHIVNYADDFVICCKAGAAEALVWVRKIVEKLKLRINESKTHIHRVPDENVEFLGYTIGRCYSAKTGKSYIGTRPSPKKISRICRDISAATGRDRLLLDSAEMVQALNRKLVGWANYFSLGPVSCRISSRG